MWNEPSTQRLSRIPKLYSTDHTALPDKLIHLHLYIGNSDWFIAECDGKDFMWGYAILGGDYTCSEWGHISLSELRRIKIGYVEVDCELAKHWQVRRAIDVAQIRKGHPHWYRHEPKLHAVMEHC